MNETADCPNPLRAKFYADHARQLTVDVVENVRLARDTYRVRFACPEIAKTIVPGQFVMLRLAGCNDPLIGRPLALYDTVVDAADAPWGLDVVYLAKGKFTSRLAALGAGTRIDVWGPLGNGFSMPDCDRFIMVAGGIGQTPFLAFANECLGRKTYGSRRRNLPVPQVTLCYGARNAEYLAGIDDFQKTGAEVRIATDDGSQGHHGLVTELLEKALAESTGSVQVACCGPEPMMEAVSLVASRRGVFCEVSLETPMACGVGICFTCVAKVRDADGNWDYKRTCVDGPVFDAAVLEWH